MARKPFLVVNPAAQAGKVAQLWEAKIRPALDAAGVAYDFEVTKARGHAIELAAQRSAAGHPVVCAVGGDGTSNEVLNGILKGGGQAAFGALPSGSGDDIPTAFGIPEKDLGAAVACLRDGQDLPFDVGHCARADRYFAGAASMGFDADVTERANRTTSGHKSYNVTVLKTLLAFKPYTLRLRVDGKDQGEQKRMLVAVGNGKRYGGGMHVCPTAEVDDGRFAVTALKETGIVGLLLLFPKIFGGEHVKSPKVDTFEGEQIAVESVGRDCLYQADGEVLGKLPETFVARRGLLRVRVPRPYVSYAEQWKARRAG